MSVLSPGIVVALITLFFINRIGERLLAFEHMLFIGLRYCIEPSEDELASLSTSASSNSAAKRSSSAKKKPAKPSASSATTAKPTPYSLPIRRNAVSPTLFMGEPELPKNRELDYLLSMGASFAMSLFFEDLAVCMFPAAAPRFDKTQTHWFGALVFVVGVYQLLGMSREMSSSVVIGVLVALGTLASLAVIANGDATSFFLLGAAFRNISVWASHIHLDVLALPAESSEKYVRIVTTSSRVLTAFLAGLLFACTAVPARRFATMDYELYKRYVRDEDEEREDAYALSKPTRWLVLLLSLDYVLPVLAVTAFCVRQPENAPEWYEAAKVVLLAATLVLRICLVRVRLQSYLDTAVSHFRNFWLERRAGDKQADGRLRVRVVSTYYYMVRIAALYMFVPVVGLTLALLAKRSGGMSLGLCKVASSVQRRLPLDVAGRELFSFLAWVNVAGYAFFAISSFVLDTLMDSLRPPPRMAHDGAAGVISSASERRRLKRMQQEKAS